MCKKGEVARVAGKDIILIKSNHFPKIENEGFFDTRLLQVIASCSTPTQGPKQSGGVFVTKYPLI